MSKAEFMSSIGGNVAASIGAVEGVSRRDSGSAPPPRTDPRTDGVERLKEARTIAVGRIMADPDQPRKDFDSEDLDRLAESLSTRGQLQPIRVRWDDATAHYIVIAGERRWRASIRAGLATVACIVQDRPASGGDLLEDQLVENCLRQDLKPIEEARAFRSLMDAKGLSTHQLAARLAISQSRVSKAVSLLSLPAELQAEVEARAIAPDAAREIARAGDDATRAELTVEARAGRLTRDGARKATAAAKGRGGKARKATSRTIRTSNGYRITVECRRGIDDEGLHAAINEALVGLRAGPAADAERAA